MRRAAMEGMGAVLPNGIRSVGNAKHKSEAFAIVVLKSQVNQSYSLCASGGRT
jgi:hypothetical protein